MCNCGPTNARHLGDCVLRNLGKIVGGKCIQGSRWPTPPYNSLQRLDISTNKYLSTCLEIIIRNQPGGQLPERVLLRSSTMTSSNVEYAAEAAMDEYMPTFYIGHHEYRRQLPVTDFALQLANDVGVSMYVLPNVFVTNACSMTC